MFGERGAQDNVSVGVLPPAESWGRAPVHGSGSEAPLKLKAYEALKIQERGNIKFTHLVFAHT